MNDDIAYLEEKHCPYWVYFRRYLEKEENRRFDLREWCDMGYINESETLFLYGVDEMFNSLMKYCESFQLKEDEDIIVANLQSYPLVLRFEIAYSILRYREYKCWEFNKILDYSDLLEHKMRELDMVNEYGSYLEELEKMNNHIDLLNKYNESYSINADQDSILTNLKTYAVKPLELMEAIVGYRDYMSYGNDKIEASIVHI
jgi:hypothetical protein